MCVLQRMCCSACVAAHVLQRDVWTLMDEEGLLVATEALVEPWIQLKGCGMRKQHPKCVEMCCSCSVLQRVSLSCTVCGNVFQ